MRRAALLVLILSLSLMLARSAQAEEVSLVVSPPHHQIEAKAGETVQKIIKITNNSTEKELILQAYVIDFLVEDNVGTPIKVEPNRAGRYLASPWFTLDRTELVIPPQGQNQIIAIISIPADALPGGHYAGVFFEPVLSKGLKQTVSYTSSQVGALFSVTLAGDISYDALIKSFASSSLFYEYGPVSFQAEIENQSDTHIRPQSSITIRNMIGRQVGSLKLDEINIFPYASRELIGEWDQIWGLGRYTATLSVIYGPGTTIERTIYFWLMPWRLVAAVVVLILVVIVIAIALRRHFEHRRDRRDDEIDELKRKIVELENNKH